MPYATLFRPIKRSRAGEGFVAVTAEARRKFWADRSRTAAISRHTNAFKLNEDVVIPLERLGDYTDEIERINIELSTRNKLALLDALEEVLSGELKLAPPDEADESTADDELLGDRPAQARQIVRATRRRWAWLLEHLDTHVSGALETLQDLLSAPLVEELARRVAVSPGLTVLPNCGAPTLAQGLPWGRRGASFRPICWRAAGCSAWPGGSALP